MQEVTSNINQFGLDYLTARRVINCSTLGRMCLKGSYPTEYRKLFKVMDGRITKDKFLKLEKIIETL
ncbi:hypothetical protein [Helicobacter pullorum]